MNIKLQKDFLSLQKGFEWNNIPMFSVITGVNGAGKTHLLKLLYESTKTLNLLHITNSKKDVFNLLLPNNSDLENETSSTKRNYKQFIQYFQSTNSRLGSKKELESRIVNFKSTLNSYQTELDNLQNSSNPDKGSVIKLEKDVKYWEENLYNQEYELNKLYDLVFEKEIKRISDLLNKDIDSLNIEDIKENAKTTFDGIFEIDTIKQFIADEIQYKNISILNERSAEKISEIQNTPESYQIINDLFSKYGFGYYTMNDPKPDINIDRDQIDTTPEKINILFKGKKGEEVSYDHLSSGEQMIVKIIILARSKNINGENINTIILDEPDAHLHPSLSRMMIEILEDLTLPIEEGGANLKVIITTHSPSTVAFAPEKSLFLMERDDNGERRVGSATKEEAVSILSDGIFTFKEAIDKFELITKSSKNNILCVEGKTDVMHIETAMSKLDEPLDLEILNLHDAGTLESFIKSIPATILGDKKIIGLFDSDDAGSKSYNRLNGTPHSNYKQLTAEQSEGKSYICCLPIPNDQLEQYCPIEFLYSYSILHKEGVLEKRELFDFIRMYNRKATDKELIEEWNNESSLRVFKVKDSMKNRFAENVSKLSKTDFENFTPLLDLLEKIINHRTS